MPQQRPPRSSRTRGKSKSPARGLTRKLSDFESDGLEKDSNHAFSVKNSFYSIFCPRSYVRGTLAQGYARFQAYDTLQALCSYLRGVLCTQALLKGIGVGSSEATAGAATLTFITKDGAGMLGSLGLAWRCSDSFGRNIKAWRLFADITNDIALAIDLYAPYYAPSNTFLVLICISSILKAWCGVSAGATRAAITSHFALHRADIADIAAKEGSQETAVTLLGMILGYLFLKYASDPNDVQTNLVWVLFWLLTFIHVYANYQAVRSLHFRTIDWQRLDILLTGNGNRPLSFAEVSAKEHLIYRGSNILHPQFKAHNPVESSAVWTRGFVHVFRNGLIVVEPSAETKDVLITCFNVRSCQLNQGPDNITESWLNRHSLKFEQLVEQLQAAGWDLEGSLSLLGDHPESRLKFKY